MAFDLYEFPKDHIGRKTYVSVRGHSRSVPYLYTYRGADGLNHVRPEYGGTADGAHFQTDYARNLCTTYFSDIQGFVSPIDGAVISSRPALAEHCKTHDVIQVGNDKWDTPSDRAPLDRPGHDIKRAIEQLGSR